MNDKIEIAGWEIEARDRKAIVTKDGLGGYAADKDAVNIASSILAEFATDIVAHLRQPSTAPAAIPGGWISVEDRMPTEDMECLVYTPARNGEEDRIDIEVFEEGCWRIHADSYEHFLMIGGARAGGDDTVATGPSEKAPYTHWIALPSAPGATPSASTALPAASPAEGEWRVGSLLTMSDYNYPGMGTMFAQVWQGDDLIARVYGDTREEVSSRAARVAAAPTAQAGELPLALERAIREFGRACGFGDTDERRSTGRALEQGILDYGQACSQAAIGSGGKPISLPEENWTVLNSAGVTISEGISMAEAKEWIHAERFSRGWSAVYCIVVNSESEWPLATAAAPTGGLDAIKAWKPNSVVLSNAIDRVEQALNNGRPEAGMMKAFHYLLDCAAIAAATKGAQS